MKPGLLIIPAILCGLLAIAGVGYLISLFNSLIQVRNNIGKAWHNIDVLLLQRNEEIPKLIDVTRAYVQYEWNVLESLTRLRTLYLTAGRTDQKTKIENELKQKMQGLKAVWEGYPDLKANELFLKLQQRISELEAAIAERRAFFNDTVTIYNIQREIFPQVIFAWMLGFRHHPLLVMLNEKGR
ncbi:MAG: LemA family protein [Nitrospirae bacterium]|nr:LemA family protein [Nitrospirota bacterium]